MNKKCAFCASTKLFEFMDFGKVALAGSFLKKQEIATEKKYPLKIVFCENCFIVQVLDHVDPDILFKNDFYFSSAIKTLQNHFTNYAKEVVERFLPDPKKSLTLEFGCNDGVLMYPIKNLGVGTVIGIDPAQNIVKTIKDDRLNVINDFFSIKSACKIVEKYGQVDVVMANNVFAHISDINGITQAIDTVLKDEGVFVFEVHYLGKIIEELQYDFIYHEHIYYYSLLALQKHFDRHNMVIFDLKHIPIHGGSIRYYVAKKGSQLANSINESVNNLEKSELQKKYDNKQIYLNFANEVKKKKDQLIVLLKESKKEGKSIVGYGASGRANTILQYCNIDNRLLDYMVDDAPAKLGMITPGTHLEIFGSQSIIDNKPNCIVIFAWAFYNEILTRNKNIFSDVEIIIPLPEVKTIKL